jgi:magnesium transporter
VSVEIVRQILEQQTRIEKGTGNEIPVSNPLAKLHQLFASLDAETVAHILDLLTPEELLLAWGAIDDERQDEILHEVLDSTRDALAARSSYLSADGVVNAFELTGGRLTQTTIESAEDLEGIKPLWVDLVGTTRSC